MIAKLGIYEDCTKAEPSKVYECHRLLYGVSKKALALSEAAEKKKTFEEQEAVLVELLQTIFPTFQPDEINYIDPAELDTLINQLQSNSAAEAERVEKN